MATDHNNTTVVADDKVIILGKISLINSGIHDVAQVEVTVQNQTQTLTFYTSDLRKATISGNDIVGILGGST